MTRHARYCRFLAPAAFLLAASFLRAQDAPQGQEPGPPERSVARISIVSGEVNVRRGDSGDWVAAVVNAPVMLGDRIATGASSRAEVQFDSANLIRIGANAEVRLAELAYNHYHLQIAHGTVSFRVLRPSTAKIEIDTPPVSVRPSQVGAYRIYVQPDGETEITSRLGTVEIATPKGSEQLQAGQTMLARGNPADPEFRVVPAISMDEWDRWNEQRDREIMSSPSYGNVPHDIYGTEDLDNHGQWVDDSTYGEVWAPNVDPDWAPYQNGRWVWEDYYGWTWVSYDPWGWAPFHWGRWFLSPRVGWCWYPGGFGYRYWSPALVGFFGFGGGVGAGAGFGFANVGWVALAPFEPVYAWWGHGFYAGYRNPAFFNRGVNITNVTVTNVFRNARVANSVSSVTAADFRQGRFGAISHATGSQIREAGLVRGQLPVAPTGASLRYANRAVANIPRSSENVHFFGRTPAATTQRVSFSEQQRAMQQFSRQPAVSTMTRGPIATGAGQSRPSVAGTGAWRRANEPAGGNTERGASGWQRFGEPRPAAWSNASNTQTGFRPYTAPAQTNANRPQSIRVTPPVVREKTQSAPRAPSSSSHASSGGATHAGGGGGGGGGAHGGGSHR